MEKIDSSFPGLRPLVEVVAGRGRGGGGPGRGDGEGRENGLRCFCTGSGRMRPWAVRPVLLPEGLLKLEGQKFASVRGAGCGGGRGGRG